MVPQHVIKRAGRVVDFDFEKINQAMVAAGAAPPIVLCDLALPELHSLLGRAALFVGNDSGPMHLAATATSRPIDPAPRTPSRVPATPPGGVVSHERPA